MTTIDICKVDKDKSNGEWAYVSVAAVETVKWKVTGIFTKFSEKHLLDCVSNGGNGCSGGVPEAGYSYYIAPTIGPVK